MPRMWDPSEYLPIIIIKYYAVIIWSFYSINVLMGLFGLLYKPRTSNIKSAKVEIVIVSIASRYVKKSLFECLAKTRERFPDVPISILVDEGADLLDELIVARRSIENFRNIVDGD